MSSGKTIESYTESEVRQLRDEVYAPSKISDKAWDETCKKHWMEPSEIRFLLKCLEHKSKNKS